MFIKGMNRLRAAYLDLDPSLAPYFITGVTDDLAGISQTYTMGPVRNVTHVAASSGVFITAINTIVAGGRDRLRAVADRAAGSPPSAGCWSASRTSRCGSTSGGATGRST